MIILSIVAGIAVIAWLWRKAWLNKPYCAVCETPARTFQQENFSKNRSLVRNHFRPNGSPCAGSHTYPAYPNREQFKKWIDRIRELHYKLSGW